MTKKTMNGLNLRKTESAPSVNKNFQTAKTFLTDLQNIPEEGKSTPKAMEKSLESHIPHKYYNFPIRK